jgi:hypothetical protein
VCKELPVQATHIISGHVLTDFHLFESDKWFLVCRMHLSSRCFKGAESGREGRIREYREVYRVGEGYSPHEESKRVLCMEMAYRTLVISPEGRRGRTGVCTDLSF